MSLAKELKELAIRRKAELPREEAENFVRMVREYAKTMANNGKTAFQWDRKCSYYIPDNPEIIKMIEEELKKDGFQVIIDRDAFGLSWGHL